MKFEILAPAGGMESLIAGVRSGANAVYLGGQVLNARRNAGNFDDENLKKAIIYCHQRNVKVYLTLNTLVADREMNQAMEQAKTALSFGVDGFIIQDVGLAKAIKSTYPDVHIHASTQMSVTSPKGFEELQKMGFCRGVLPREMTKNEIEQIRKSTKMELEIFVHGALCMCVSGQCYLSSMIGSRSGNRGLCAQPCRLPFSADDSKSCDLSLKDLSLVSKIKEIGELGVVSLKIEGRMKRPEYVAAAVTALKKAINSQYNSADEQVLKSVFSRSGFTTGYFDDKRGAQMFGTRLKGDVTAAKEVLKDLSHLYDNENPLIKVQMDFVCKKSQNIKLTIKTDKKSVTVYGKEPEKAINKPMSIESVQSRLKKLGGTQYFADEVDVTLDDGLIVSAAAMNELRREAVEKLNETEVLPLKSQPYCVAKPADKNSKPYFTARFAQASQIPQHHNFKRIFLPIWCEEDSFVQHNAGVELPRGIFGVEDRIIQKLSILKQMGVKNALCPSLSAYALARDMGFQVFGDFGLNVFNSESAQNFLHPILSFELTLEDANKINAKDTGLIVYGKVPLMLTRNCPVKAHIGCEECKKQGVLTDRKGYKFSVVCSPYPCVELLNCVPIYMADRMNEVKTDFAHFYFSTETKEQVQNVISLFENGAKPPFDYTRGLYQRGTL